MRSRGIIMMTGDPFMTSPRSFMKERDAVTTSSGIVMTSPRPVLMVPHPLYTSEPMLKPERCIILVPWGRVMTEQGPAM